MHFDRNHVASKFTTITEFHRILSKAIHDSSCALDYRAHEVSADRPEREKAEHKLRVEAT